MLTIYPTDYLMKDQGHYLIMNIVKHVQIINNSVKDILEKQIVNLVILFLTSFNKLNNLLKTFVINVEQYNNKRLVYNAVRQQLEMLKQMDII